MRKSFLLSATLHVVVASFGLFGLFQTKKPQSSPSSIEVQTLSQSEFDQKLKRAFLKNQKQIVQIDPKLKSDQAPDQSNGERVFYSSHNQRVDRNTKAAHVGTFKNVINSGSKGEASNINKLFNLQADKVAKVVEPEVMSTGRLRKPASAEGNGQGASATDDYLEDVAIGAQTILNANEYRFYGFYARIREQLIHQWHQRLKIEIQKLESEGRPIVNTTRRTQVRVFLNAAGTLQNTQLLGSSGLAELDRAATDAFRLAAPFAHPPREMIGEDGLVPIRWEFVVVSSGSHGVQFRVERTGIR